MFCKRHFLYSQNYISVYTFVYGRLLNAILLYSMTQILLLIFEVAYQMPLLECQSPVLYSVAVAISLVFLIPNINRVESYLQSMPVTETSKLALDIYFETSSFVSLFVQTQCCVRQNIYITLTSVYFTKSSTLCFRCCFLEICSGESSTVQ